MEIIDPHLTTIIIKSLSQGGSYNQICQEVNQWLMEITQASGVLVWVNSQYPKIISSTLNLTTDPFQYIREVWSQRPELNSSGRVTLSSRSMENHLLIRTGSWNSHQVYLLLFNPQTPADQLKPLESLLQGWELLYALYHRRFLTAKLIKVLSYETRSAIHSVHGFAQLIKVYMNQTFTNKGINTNDMVNKIIDTSHGVITVMNNLSSYAALQAESIGEREIMTLREDIEAVFRYQEKQLKKELNYDLDNYLYDLQFQTDHNRLSSILEIMVYLCTYQNKSPRLHLSIQPTHLPDSNSLRLTFYSQQLLSLPEIQNVDTIFDRIDPTMVQNCISYMLANLKAQTLEMHMYYEKEEDHFEFNLILPILDSSHNQNLLTEKPVLAPQPIFQDEALVVYVEDNPENCELLENIFMDLDCQLIIYSLGYEALQALETRQPQILLLDLNLPDINGLDILKKVRDMDHLKEIPVYIITADSSIATRNLCLESSAQGVITKPIDILKLIQLVEGLLFLDQ